MTAERVGDGGVIVILNSEEERNGYLKFCASGMSKSQHSCAGGMESDEILNFRGNSSLGEGRRVRSTANTPRGRRYGMVYGRGSRGDAIVGWGRFDSKFGPFLRKMVNFLREGLEGERRWAYLRDF